MISQLAKHWTDRQTRAQIIRFLIAGLATTTADYGTFLLLKNLIGTGLFVASLASLAAGFVVSFTINRLWVFGADSRHSKQSGWLQLVMYSALFSFNVAFTYLFIGQLELMGIEAYKSKIIAIGLITIWNFVFYKKFIFKVRR